MSTTTTLAKSHVESIFRNIADGNSSAFFAQVVDNVDWLVTGDSHPLAGRWNSKEQYIKESWSRVGAILTQPMKLSVLNVIVQPDGIGLKGTAAVELKGVDGILKNGTEYNNEYCWIVGFNEEGKIASVRAYLDSAKLRNALEANE